MNFELLPGMWKGFYYWYSWVWIIFAVHCSIDSLDSSISWWWHWPGWGVMVNKPGPPSTPLTGQIVEHFVKHLFHLHYHKDRYRQLCCITFRFSFSDMSSSFLFGIKKINISELLSFVTFHSFYFASFYVLAAMKLWFPSLKTYKTASSLWSRGMWQCHTTFIMCSAVVGVSRQRQILSSTLSFCGNTSWYHFSGIYHKRVFLWTYPCVKMI